MATTSMMWNIKGREITVTTTVDEGNPNKVVSSKFHYVQMQGRRAVVSAKMNKSEFFEDCTTQVSYLATTGFSDQDFFDAIIYASAEHIDKFKRILLADLWGYISVCMFIMDATKGTFHNLYQTEEQAIQLRNAFEENAKNGLRQYLVAN